jgi:Tol biopolymer transport system component
MPLESDMFFARPSLLTRVGILLCCLTGILSTTFAQSPPTGLITVNRFSNGGGDQFTPGESVSFSSSGRYVVFATASSNLVPNDNNNASDVFVRDRQTGQTILVSVNAAGTGAGNVGGGGQTAISPDGRYVAFISDSTNLVANDSAAFVGTQVFIRDLQTNVTKLVSRNFAGTGHGNSFVDVFSRLSISDDGRFVAFTSRASDLVSVPDTNSEMDVFVRDVQNETTRLVSFNLNGTAAGMRGSDNGVMSANGKFVAFYSFAKDLVSLNIQFGTQAYIRDLDNNVNKLVTPNRFGTDGTGVDSGSERDMAISSDGRYVAFVSDSPDVAANDTGVLQDVFVRDTQTDTTKLVSVNMNGGTSGTGTSGQMSMSPDGRYVVFISGANDLVANDTNNQRDIFLRDLQANMTSLITINTLGNPAGTGFADSQFIQRQYRPSVSSDGRYVAFTSTASDLISGTDTNGGSPSIDVFVRDRQTNSTKLITTNYLGTDSGSGGSALYSMVSGDGKLVFYFSGMRDLVGNDFNNFGDIFVFSNLPQPDQARFKIAVTDINENAGTAIVSVILPNIAAVPVSVGFNTTNGTAVSGTDYLATSGTLNFAPGEVEKTFPITILNDSVIENDEIIIVRLSNPTGGFTLGDPNIASVKIIDDEPPPTLSISDITTHEGDIGQFPAPFVVTLSGPTERAVSVVLTTQAGSAASNVDFVGGALQITFAPGQTSQVVNAFTIGDFSVEGTEDFFINLSSPVNATIADSQGVITIIDDDTFLILTEENSQRAAALDSVLLTRDILPVKNDLNFSSDHVTRVSFFVIGLKLNFQEPASAIIATAEDSQGTIFPLTVESADFVSSGFWVQQVVVRLNPQITTPGDYKIKFTLHGTPSNTVVLGLRPQ